MELIFPFTIDFADYFCIFTLSRAGVSLVNALLATVYMYLLV